MNHKSFGPLRFVKCQSGFLHHHDSSTGLQVGQHNHKNIKIKMLMHDLLSTGLIEDKSSFHD